MLRRDFGDTRERLEHFEDLGIMVIVDVVVIAEVFAERRSAAPFVFGQAAIERNAVDGGRATGRLRGNHC